MSCKINYEKYKPIKKTSMTSACLYTMHPLAAGPTQMAIVVSNFSPAAHRENRIISDVKQVMIVYAEKFTVRVVIILFDRLK